MFGKLGAAKEVERCRVIVQNIEERAKTLVASDEPDSNGESWAQCHSPCLLILYSQCIVVNDDVNAMLPISSSHQPISGRISRSKLSRSSLLLLSPSPLFP